MIKKMLIFIGFILPLQIFAQNEMWVARYDRVGYPYYDHAFAMVIDDSGYIYVTGTSWDTITSADYATIKYNSFGDTVWVRRYNNSPSNSDDDAYAIAVDKSGNVYVTGESYGNGTGYDYATIKYNSSGDTMWVRRYNYSGSTYDVAHAITVDSSGNVYVTGYSTIKYDSLGNTMWVKRFGEMYAITIDNDGNVYTTGRNNGKGGYDYATIKYNSFGDTMWVRVYNGIVKGYDKTKAVPLTYGGGGAAIAVDISGNVYVTGGHWGTDSSYVTIKYNNSGDTMWTRKYHGPDSTGKDEATALAIDNSGNVYVTGRSYSSDTNPDYATIKYNSSGDTVWVRRYNGPGNSYDWANAIAVDNSENVYVTGRSCDTGTYYPDYATIKYSSSGSEEWVQRYNGPSNWDDNAYAIAVDNKGYVYVTGSSASSSSGDDYVTIKYSTVGIEEPSNLDWGLGIGELKAFPNPFAQKTVVSGQWSVASKTKIRIYDISGKLVETHSITQSPPWQNVPSPNNSITQISIGEKLKTGIYFVKVNDYLTADRHVKPIKIIKISYIK
ncbi:MAG: SBBP repeat-containing protein [bacterium]|nr:SBBP repeat-containing protein [bacterium]